MNFENVSVKTRKQSKRNKNKDRESKTKQNKTKQKINFTVIGDFHPLGKVSHEN